MAPKSEARSLASLEGTPIGRKVVLWKLIESLVASSKSFKALLTARIPSGVARRKIRVSSAYCKIGQGALSRRG
jgi:hypothetical protein